jgi:hypothetical protein
MDAAQELTYEDLFPGRFLTAEKDFSDGIVQTFTIMDLQREEFPPRKKGAPPEVKGVLSFRETKKQLTLNKTNAECLKGMFGLRLSGWIGKRITFFRQKVRGPGGKMVWGIRVRGSPDIQQDMPVDIRVRGITATVTMQRTGRAPQRKGLNIIDVPAENDEMQTEEPPDEDGVP